MSNFNKRLKYVALKKILEKMCQELRRRRFDIIYANMIDKNDCKPRLKFWQKSNLSAYIMNLTEVPNKH
jgi:hypothetical protein